MFGIYLISFHMHPYTLALPCYHTIKLLPATVTSYLRNILSIDHYNNRTIPSIISLQYISLFKKEGKRVRKRKYPLLHQPKEQRNKEKEKDNNIYNEINH